MKSVNRKFFMFAGILVIVFTILTACAHTIPVVPNPPLYPLVDKIPLEVGLYVSEELKNFQVSEYKMGDQWNYINIGAASASQFKLCLDQRFLSAELVDRIPPFPAQKEMTIHAIIEPVIDRFDFDIPLTKFQVYPARIRYIIKVYDVAGNIILKDEVEGIGDTQGQGGFDFSENPSKSASKAVEDGVQKAVEKIAGSHEIMRLVESGNVPDQQTGKGDFASALKNPNPSYAAGTELDIEKQRLKDEQARVEQLRREIAQLKAEKSQEPGSETPKLAYITERMKAPRVSLRKEPLMITNQGKITEMLRKYDFFDYTRNAFGSFENGLIDNHDGTVTDGATGLMWQKSGSLNFLNNMRAKEYIKQLNRKRFADYSGWRMPTVEELASLLKKGRIKGIHLAPVFDNKQIRCWTIDECDPSYAQYSGAWIVDFKEGTILESWYYKYSDTGGTYVKNIFNHVKAVRSLE